MSSASSLSTIALSSDFCSGLNDTSSSSRPSRSSTKARKLLSWWIPASINCRPCVFINTLDGRGHLWFPPFLHEDISICDSYFTKYCIFTVGSLKCTCLYQILCGSSGKFDVAPI